MTQCPHCSKPLTESQVKAIWGSYTSSRRVKPSGGRKGGRPRLEPISKAELNERLAAGMQADAEIRKI